MTGYTLIRAKRRTMSLQLDRDGHAVVRAPYGVKKEFIDRFVAEHEDWLTRACCFSRARVSQSSCSATKRSMNSFLTP